MGQGERSHATSVTPTKRPAFALFSAAFEPRDWIGDCWADATLLNSNSFFLIPVFHFPWSEKGREARLARSETNTTQNA